MCGAQICVMHQHIWYMTICSAIIEIMLYQLIKMMQQLNKNDSIPFGFCLPNNDYGSYIYAMIKHSQNINNELLVENACCNEGNKNTVHYFEEKETFYWRFSKFSVL